MASDMLARQARIYRSALLAEVLKARAGDALATDVKAFVASAAFWSDRQVEERLADLATALAGYATKLHLISQDPSLYNELPDVLEGLRRAAERRIKDDVDDIRLGVDSPYPDNGETHVLVSAGTMRAVARLLGIDTLGV